jgi:hypothetical protein
MHFVNNAHIHEPRDLERNRNGIRVWLTYGLFIELDKARCFRVALVVEALAFLLLVASSDIKLTAFPRTRAKASLHKKVGLVVTNNARARAEEFSCAQLLVHFNACGEFVLHTCSFPAALFKD